MLMMSVNREAFFLLSEVRQRILAAFEEGGVYEDLRQATSNPSYSVSEIGIPSLRHFLYVSKTTVQFTTPQWEAPYTTSKEQRRLFRLYQHAHSRAAVRARPRKVYFLAGTHEVVMAWNTGSFELYATFAPLVAKETAISALNLLLRWIKKEEQSLFILNSLVF